MTTIVVHGGVRVKISVDMRIFETTHPHKHVTHYSTVVVIDRVATAQGKQGIWFLLLPDRENTWNFAVAQGKSLRHRENINFSF